MYIGRFLVVGKTPSGKRFIGYRVSSRSFPNREARILNNTVSIVPKNLEEIFSNPYICYNCIVVKDETVVAGNGSHTDFIAEKLHMGYKEALATVLITMDFEKDEYGTPRIAGILDREKCYLGYVKDSALRVTKFKLKDNGVGYYLGVYNACKITKKQKINIFGETPEELAEYILNYDKFEYPVASAVALFDDNNIKIAVKNIR